LKIVYLVTRSDTIGGSHIHVRDMAIAMKKAGHIASVIMGGDGPVIDHFKGFGIEPVIVPELIRNISLIQDVKAYNRLLNLISDLAPDIVSTHSSKAGFLGRLAAHKLKLPVLFTAHGWSFTTGKPGFKTTIYKTLEKWIAPTTDKIITVSDFDKQLAINQLKLSEDKVVTVYNGMRDVSKKYRTVNSNDNPVNIVMIARFDQQKDHRELLNAVYDIHNIHLHFVGDGPLMNNVKQQAATLAISDKVTFWGRLDSVEEILSKGHIFTLISNWEGFPRSTLEAMRAGLPTIVSDVGGAGEAVEQNKTGYVVGKGDIQTLKKNVQNLVVNKAKRTEMGKAARVRYEKLYTFDIMFKKTNEIYNELLETRSSENES